MKRALRWPDGRVAYEMTCRNGHQRWVGAYEYVGVNNDVFTRFFGDIPAANPLVEAARARAAAVEAERVAARALRAAAFAAARVEPAYMSEYDDVGVSI